MFYQFLKFTFNPNIKVDIGFIVPTRTSGSISLFLLQSIPKLLTCTYTLMRLNTF